MTKKILIIDDDIDSCKMLSDFLETEGYESEYILNGLQLIKKIKVERPALILLDIMMSWVSGIELCKAIKTNDEYKNIPVVFITARIDEKTKKDALESGGDEYLTKPLDLNGLSKIIKKYTGGAKLKK